MSSETLLDTPGGLMVRPPSNNSPLHKSPSPPSTTTLASHLLAAVSQVQSLTSQLPPSIPIPTSSPSPGGNNGGMGCYRPTGLLGGGFSPHLQQFGGEPPMSSLLAGLKDFPRQYHSPPPLPSSENHECKIVEYRGAKVAAFIINGETMLCLPQAFELFLKHLVGGLHTVYTKLKRLGIEPLVCNVDQVRILRGLGAIQPGVNRCKLLAVKHFDILYRDCTTASSRPGRPPKRASDFMTMSPTQDALFDLKKRHLENGVMGGGGFHNGHIGSDGMFGLDENWGSCPGTDWHQYGSGKVPFSARTTYPSSNPRLDKSPLLANGYHAPPHFNPLQYMAHHMAGLGYPPLLPGNLPGGLPGGPPPPHPISPTESSPLKHTPITPETLARLHEERVDRERQMALEHRISLASTPTSASTPFYTPQSTHTPQSNQVNSQHTPPTSTSHDDLHRPPSSPVLNLSSKDRQNSENGDDKDDLDNDMSNGDQQTLGDDMEQRRIHLPPLPPRERENTEERLSDMDDDDVDKDESMDTADIWTRSSSTPGQTQVTSPLGTTGMAHLGLGNNAPLSSTEVLLRNILGLLRVAEENARHHERQTQYEKAELKMEVLRERELRENLEKQLQEEQKNRILMQKRCAKLKKLRRRLQERLDEEVKMRCRGDERPGSPEAISEFNGKYFTGRRSPEGLRKDMEAIAAELKQQESLSSSLDAERSREVVDRLLSSPSLVNHPGTAITTAAANSWR